MTKTMAGRNPAEMPPAVTACCTKAGVDRRSRQTPLRVQASTRMTLAGIMFFMPSMHPSRKSFMVTRRRGTNCRKATVRAPKEAQTRALEAEALPREATKPWYLGSLPQ